MLLVMAMLAAAGLLALEEGPKGLAADHANAKYIAGRLARMERVSVYPVETNIVIYDVSATGRSSKEISAELKARERPLVGSRLVRDAPRWFRPLKV